VRILLHPISAFATIRVCCYFGCLWHAWPSILRKERAVAIATSYPGEFFMLMRILLRSASFTVPKPDEENPSDELARSHEENERSIVFSVRVHTHHKQV
jgi:hypothetical protein